MRSLMLACLSVTALVVGCSAAPIDPIQQSDAGSGDAAFDPETSDDASAAKVHRVEANDFAYVPATLTIKAGDTVEWVFTSGTHTVTSGKNCTKNNQVDTGVHSAPYTFRRTFPDPGVFDYFCSYRQHCQMGQVGKITIEP
jgi:plastocyanin